MHRHNMHGDFSDNVSLITHYNNKKNLFIYTSARGSCASDGQQVICMEKKPEIKVANSLKHPSCGTS